MLRAVHVIGRMPGHGTQRQLAGMLKVAHGRFWDATLTVLRAGDPLAQEVADAGVPVVQFAGPEADPRRFTWLRRAIEDADLVHTSLWGANVFGRLVAHSRRRPPAVVISEHSVEDLRPTSHRLIDRALRRCTDEYIANSRDVARFLARAHRVPIERVTVIRNAIDRNVFHPATSSRQRHRPARLGAVGRLEPVKGLDVLLAAMPEIVRKRPVELTLVGDGSERPGLERMAKGLPVVFAGHMDAPSDVATFLRSLDVFIMPSRWEGFPNALLEALACGVTAVVTDVPGMREAAEDQAVFVPPDRPAALAEAVDRALASPPPPPTISVRAFEDMATAHLEVFERALARRGSIERSA
jgi:glycosyltransferase involved in cell wall biosynthesis